MDRGDSVRMRVHKQAMLVAVDRVNAGGFGRPKSKKVDKHLQVTLCRYKHACMHAYKPTYRHTNKNEQHACKNTLVLTYMHRNIQTNMGV